VWDSLAMAPSTAVPTKSRRTHIKTLTGHSRFGTPLNTPSHL
jgi:hypothetical protein